MKHFLSVRVLTKEQFDIVVCHDSVSRIYIEADFALSENLDLSHFDKRIFIVFPDVFTDKAYKLIDSSYDELINYADGFMIHNLDELFYLSEKGYDLSKVIGSERLYAYNTEAVNFYKENGLHNLTHPVELTYNQGYDIIFESVEEVIYGRTALMVSQGCVHKNTSKCDGIKQNLILKDRKKMDFFVQNRCDYCYNTIYNSVPIMVIDELDKLHKKANSVRIDFTFENINQINNILSLYEVCCDGICPNKDEIRLLVGDFTRGHYHKGMIS